MAKMVIFNYVPGMGFSEGESPIGNSGVVRPNPERIDTWKSTRLRRGKRLRGDPLQRWQYLA